MSDFAVVYVLTWLSVILAPASFAVTLTVLDSRWWRNRRQRRQIRIAEASELALERVRLTSRDGSLWHKEIDRPRTLDTSLHQSRSIRA